MPKRKGNKTDGSDDQTKRSSDNDRSWLSPISFSSSTSHDAFLPEHPRGTLPPLSLSSSPEHGSNHSLSKWDLSPDEFGQPLTKDMLKKKDKIDQVADKLLQDHQRRKKGQSMDMSYLDKRHSDDELAHIKDAMLERGGYTSDGRGSSNLSSRPSSPRSSRRSSIFRSDESRILESFSKNIRSDTNQSMMTSNKAKDYKAALEDLPADDPLWLQVPTWSSSQTGLKPWLYRSATRCMTSRGCETGDILLDLTTDEILQVAHNVRALHDHHNRVILEQALKGNDTSRLRENSLSGKKRYAPSVLSMATTVSNWDDVEQNHRLSLGKDSDHHLQFDDQSKRSLDGAVSNSVSPRPLSASETSPKSPPGSSRSSNVERGSDTLLYSNETYQADPRQSFSTAEGACTAKSGVPKIVQLGISDEDEKIEVVRPYLRFENTTLHFVSRTNKVRLILWRILGKWWFDTFLFALLIVNWAMLSFVPIYDRIEKITWRDRITNIPEGIIYSIFTVEILMKIFVYGLINTEDRFWSVLDLRHTGIYAKEHQRKQSILARFRSRRYGPEETPSSEPPEYSSRRHSSIGYDPKNNAAFAVEEPSAINSILPTSEVKQQFTDSDGTVIIYHNAYLSSFWNILDFTAILAYWVNFALLQYEYPWCSFFKAWSAMRCLRLLFLTEGTSVIMRSLSECTGMLWNTLFIFFFFWLLFSLIGLFVFEGSLGRRCVVYENDDPVSNNWQNYEVVEPEMFCTGYYEQNAIDGSRSQLGIYNMRANSFLPASTGYFCPVGQFCIQDDRLTPEWTYLSFNNIFYAMVNVFTIISIEDWSYMMYMSQDATSIIGAPFFYIFCVYFMTFIMVPLFVAVITNSFARIRGESKASAFSAKENKEQLQTDEKGGQWKIITELRDDDTSWFRNLCCCLVNNPYFSIIFNLLIVAYFLAQAIYPQQFQFYDENVTLTTWDYIEIAFSILLLIEVVLRFYSCNPFTNFWLKKRNCLDLIIAVTTCIILIPPIIHSPAYRFLTIFQVARTYRLVLLFPAINRLLISILGDGRGLLNLTFFTFLSLLLLCPVATQLFGGDFDVVAATDEPVMRFDNFYQSFLSLFQILTGENWTEILYNTMQSQANFSTVYAGLFTIFFYFIGHYVVLNLFIAIIMENFDPGDDEIRQIQIQKYARRNRPRMNQLHMDIISRMVLPLCQVKESKPIMVSKLPPGLLYSAPRETFFNFLESDSFEEKSPALKQEPSRWYTNATFNSLNESQNVDFGVMDDDYEANVIKDQEALEKQTAQKVRTMLFFGQDSKIRKLCQWIVGSSSNPLEEKRNIYNWFIICCILFATILTTLDDPVRRFQGNPYISFTTFLYLDNAMLIIFVIDIIIRIIAEGLIILPTSYLRNNWNIFDLIIVLLQIVAAFGPLMGPSRAVRLIQSFQALRIFRIVRYFGSMRLIFVDLFHGIPNMVLALMLMVMIYIPFALYGVNLFGGRFQYCNDGDAPGMDDCHGEFAIDEGHPIYQPRIWDNPYHYNFDTFGQALLHLVLIASGEGWIISLFSAMSIAPELGQHPSFDWYSGSIWYCLYYIIFMFVGSIFILQLFIGVILENFKQRNGISSLTIPQRQYKDMQRRMSYLKPTRKLKEPRSFIRRICFNMILDKHGLYAKFLTVVVILNIAVFAAQHSYEPHWLEVFSDIIYLVFIGIYALDVIIKITGLGYQRWVHNKWYCYDAIVTLIALATVILQYLIANEVPMFVEKLVLIALAFRLVQRSKILSELFQNVQVSFPSILNVSIVFFMTLFAFGIIFNHFFALVKYGPNGTAHANFRSIGNSLQTLFRMTTGEDWNSLLADFGVQYPNCALWGETRGDCGQPIFVYFIFIIFHFLCSYIFVNLLTVVVINNFSYAFDKRNLSNLISKDDLQLFKLAWSNIDPKATGYIRRKDIGRFLQTLDGKLGIRFYPRKLSVQSLLQKSRRPWNYDTGNPPTHSQKIMAIFYHKMSIPHFNTEEVAKALAEMDQEVVAERRRTFNFKYKELESLVGPQGLPFSEALRALALSLVDIAQALTLDELVTQASQEARIKDAVAIEKARGVFLTHIQRKRFLQWREEQGERELAKIRYHNLGITVPRPPPLSVPKWSEGKSAGVPTIVIDSKRTEQPRLNQDLLHPHSPRTLAPKHDRDSVDYGRDESRLRDQSPDSITRRTSSGGSSDSTESRSPRLSPTRSPNLNISETSSDIAGDLDHSEWQRLLNDADDE